MDFIIITNDEFIPESNHEKMSIHHKFNPLIRKFRKQILNVGVHTYLAELPGRDIRDHRKKAKTQEP